MLSRTTGIHAEERAQENEQEMEKIVEKHTGIESYFWKKKPLPAAALVEAVELEAPAWNQVVTPTVDPAGPLPPAPLPPGPPPQWEAVGEMSSTAKNRMESESESEERKGMAIFIYYDLPWGSRAFANIYGNKTRVLCSRDGGRNDDNEGKKHEHKKIEPRKISLP